MRTPQSWPWPRPCSPTTRARAWPDRVGRSSGRSSARGSKLQPTRSSTPCSATSGAGIIPGPQQRPYDVESALAARAEEAAALYPDLTFWRCRHGIPDILAFADSGLGAQHGAWQTPPTPFVRFAVRSAAVEQAMGQDGAGAAGLCVLRPGDRHGAAELGFEVVIEWEAFARRVLRDDILRTVALRAKGQNELLLTVEFTGGPQAMPCRVRTAVPHVESLPKCDRRRRRR